MQADARAPRAGSWLVAFLLLFSSVATLSSVAHHANAQTSPTVTGVGQWTQEGNYGSSSTSTSSPGVGVLGVQCVTNSGYVYCIGGQNPQGTDTSNVYYAKASSSGGSLSGWTETTDYGAASGTSGSGGTGIEWPGCITYNSYVYCVGGALSVSPYITSKTFYAPLTTTGVGPWTETTDYGATSGTTGSGGAPSFQLACVEDSGYIYCVGGSGGGPNSKVYFAQLSSSGIGPWAETTDYGAASGTSGTGGLSIGATACVDDAGYIYCIGGITTGFKPVSNVFYAPVSSTGVGAWSEATDYGASSGSSGTGGEPIYGTNCVLYSGYVICVSGDTTGNKGTGNVYFGKDEDIAAWVLSMAFPEDDYWEDCVVVYGWVFCWGADNEMSYAAPIEIEESTTSTTETSTSTSTPSTTTTPSTSTSTSTTTSTTTTPTSTSSTSTSTSSSTSSSSSSQSTNETTIVPNQPVLKTSMQPGSIHAGGGADDSAFFLQSATNHAPSGGTVTYSAWSGPNCSGTQTQLGSPAQVNPNGSGQVLQNSPYSTFPTPGTYYFSAHYSGDATDNPADSPCETLLVIPNSSTTTTTGSTGVGAPGTTVSSGNNDDILIGVGVIVVIALAGGGYIITRKKPGDTTEKPPPPPPGNNPPPPPPPPPPPVGVGVPLVDVYRDPCPPGSEPQTFTKASAEFDLHFDAAARVDIDSVYQFGEKEVDEAMEGLEKFLKANTVISKLQSLVAEPVEVVSGMIEGITTDSAADSALAGIKKLKKQLKAFREEFGYMTVTLPGARFRIECVQTRECRHGHWVITDRQVILTMIGTLPPKVWPEGGAVQVTNAEETASQLSKFGTYVEQLNGPGKATQASIEQACR